jgi:hypothetical protein
MRKCVDNGATQSQPQLLIAARFGKEVDDLIYCRFAVCSPLGLKGLNVETIRKRYRWQLWQIQQFKKTKPA